MLNKTSWALLLSVIAVCLLIPQAFAKTNPGDYAHLPFRFEPNQGQSDPGVRYVARAQRYTVFLTEDTAVLSAPPAGQSMASRAVVRMRFVGANPTALAHGTRRMSSYSNYFVGNDPKAWHTGIPNFAEVRFSNLYPGIDVHFYGSNRELEYDVIVKPSADPKAIRISLDGSTGVKLDSSGDAVVRFGSGEFRLHSPRMYQINGGGTRDLVSGAYVLSANELTFKIGAYDRGRNLIIDPVLSYSTYLGGTVDDLGNGVAVDRNGNAYVAGWTDSVDFPVANAYQDHDNAQYANAFLTKFSRDGKTVVFSTYLGGSDAYSCGGDSAWALALNPAGEAFVAGQAYSADFPVTANAYQKTGGGCGLGGDGGSGFVTRFSADGKSLLYSTYFGGNFIPFPTSILAIALDTHGNAYVTGRDQTDLLGTPGAFQSTLDAGGDQGAFVAKLSANGSKLIYCTYVRALQSGNTIGKSIAVDALGHAFLTGTAGTDNFPVTTGALQTTFGGGSADAFVTVVDASGSDLLYSTYLGGSDYDYGTGIAIDSTGSAYVTGAASSKDFPTTSGAFQNSYPGGTVSAFVTELATNGSAVYSTYLGGNISSAATGIAINPTCQSNCSVYVYGSTQATIFPLRFPIRTTGDLFVTTLNPAGSQLGSYSTRFGSSSRDFPTMIAIDRQGNAYITGWTQSSTFPTTPGAFQSNYSGGKFFGDAYLAKIAAK